MPPPLRRIPLLPLAGLGIVLVAGLAAFLLSRSVVASNGWVNHTVRVQLGVEELAEHMAAQESAFRGYLLRGDPSLLEDYAISGRSAAQHIAALHMAMADNPPQAARMATIARLIAHRVRYMQGYIEQRQRLGELPPPTPDDLRYGRPLGLRIRADLRELLRNEQRLLAEREVRTQREIDALSLFLAAAVLLVVLVAYGTIGDARARFHAVTEAHRAARAAVKAQQAEMRAREEAETQLRQVQRIESIGQLTGGIAHDFNNMLAVIIGSLDMAERRRDDPVRVAQHLASARDGADRAASLVKRLLAFSRRQPLAPSIIDPNAMIAGMTDLLARTLGEQVSVETELGPGIWTIRADSGQLENSILNLALNGRDAMDNGGALTIRTANERVEAARAAATPGLAAGDYVSFAVEDRGTGMSKEVRARAFDPFFTTKPVGKGTGLGLSQVFGFVKQSGGYVAIDERPGGGTIVRFLLPRTLAPVAEIALAGEAARSDGGGRRILVVEDDERVRTFSVEALRELGYEPLAAENGAVALDLLMREPEPDLLFTDVVMPGLSGPELVSIVRAERPDMRVLFTTGYAREAAGDVGGGPLDPAIAVLPKPFTVSQLARRVRAALDAG